MTEPNLSDPNQGPVDPNHIAVEHYSHSVEGTGVASGDKLDQLIAIAQAVKEALFKRTVFIAATLVVGLLMMATLVAIGLSNYRNGNLLVECTTPGPKPAPITGNACWDRLHAPTDTNTAIAVIVDDIYCDHRRAQAKLPPVSDPMKTCRSQTPPEILGGS